MYLLKRKISPYSGYDQILSIARSIEVAKQLKDQYIEKRLREDPWSKQAHYDVNLEKDTIIEDISSFFKEKEMTNAIFFIVCHLEDHLGLASLKIQKIFETRAVAEEYIQHFYEYCDLLQDDEDIEVFEPEKTAQDYIQNVYTQLDSNKEEAYFKNWGGELKIYEVQENVLCVEKLPSYYKPLEKKATEEKTSILRQFKEYLKKKFFKI